MTMQSIGTLAANIVDPWSWYFAALKSPSEIGKSIPLHHEPHQGYFRTRRKGGQWEAVAIFFPEGSDELVAYRNGKEVRADEVWTYCATNPISYEHYQAAIDGKGFADEPQAPAGIGDNSGDTDPFEALRIEYLGEKEQAEDFMKLEVTTQAQADKVAIWAKRLTEIAKRADQMRVVEKQPHLDACRAVDDKFRDLKEEPDLLAKRLKLHIKPFLQAQIRAEEERQRKAREEADRIRRQAEEEARMAREADHQSEQAHAETAERQRELAAQARVAEAEAEARRVNAGRTGARVSMRIDKVGVVTDYGKAAAALVAMNHKDMIAVIDQLANRAAKAGMPFDGMEIREEERVV